jgi:hypothetical protein
MNQTPIMVDDKRHEPYSPMHRMVADYQGDVDAVIKKMSPKWENIAERHAKLPEDADELERLLLEHEQYSAQKERAEVESMRGKTVKYGKPGHMYEVHINAHPDHMMDWDKPLSEQPSHITKSLFDARKEIPTLWEKTQHHINNDSTAGDFYQSIAAGHPHGYAGATEQLSRAGIKGIRYLDAGSRSDKSQQTHNYVVFDHNDVRVKRKYERGGRVRFSQGGTDSYDYRGEHQAPGPEGGAPLHDLTKVYPDDVYGPNGFQYYGETGNPSDRANFSLVQSMRGKPNAPVTMYRAVPNVPSVAKELAKLEEDMANYQRRGRLPRDAWTTDKTRWYDSSAHQRDLLREKAEKEKLNPPAEIGINAGDWVTTNRQYAKDHGESALNGNYKILTKKARAKELFTAGDSHHEWGYHPEKKAEGGAVDNDVIPHGDPKREHNLTKWHHGSHPLLKNKDGTPKTLYHGTQSDFSTFRKSQTGEFGPGIYSTDLPDEAADYAGTHPFAGKGPHVLPIHVRMKNPFVVNKSPDEFWNKFGGKTDEDAMFNAMAAGHDGVIFTRPYQFYDERSKQFVKTGQDHTHYVAFSPNQIKSATGNNGNFDPANPDITKADGGEVDDIPDIKNPISVFPKPQRMFPEENRPAGGQYLNAKTKEDMTGHKAAQASIGIAPNGRPTFNVSPDAVEQTGSHGKGNATAKTNLFKQKAGWKWVDAPEGHEDTGTIVSVEHRGHHHYALNAHFPKGVDLARYENSTSEPRLRPTTKGNVTKGDQVGTISVRGKEHPVYNHVIVKAGGGPIVKRALELLSKDRTGR